MAPKLKSICYYNYKCVTATIHLVARADYPMAMSAGHQVRKHGIHQDDKKTSAAVEIQSDMHQT